MKRYRVGLFAGGIIAVGGTAAAIIAIVLGKDTLGVSLLICPVIGFAVMFLSVLAGSMHADRRGGGVP